MYELNNIYPQNTIIMYIYIQIYIYTYMYELNNIYARPINNNSFMITHTYATLKHIFRLQSCCCYCLTIIIEFMLFYLTANI